MVILVGVRLSRFCGLIVRVPRRQADFNGRSQGRSAGGELAILRQLASVCDDLTRGVFLRRPVLLTTALSPANRELVALAAGLSRHGPASLHVIGLVSTLA